MALAARCVSLLRLTGPEGIGGSRWRLCAQQQRCGFKKETRKPELRRAEEEAAPKDPLHSRDPAPRDPAQVEARAREPAPQQGPQQGPHRQGPQQGPHRQGPQQGPHQGPHSQGPQQGPHQGPHQGLHRQGPQQGPHQGPHRQGPQQGPHQGPHQGPQQGPQQGLHRQGPHRQGPQQGPQQGPHREFGQLVKPFFFTVGFTGCAFGSAAIWQYESLKSRVQSYFGKAQVDSSDKLQTNKKEDWLKYVNQWWNSLSEGQRTVTGIIAANLVVYCCWGIPALQRTMVFYFTASPASKPQCIPMLLSAFSHYRPLHLATNMCVLWSFSSSAVSILGQEQFMAVYLSAGVISSFVSYVAKTATGRVGFSLGASGAIMTVLAAVCTKMPETKLGLLLLPMISFPAGTALKAIVALDSVGLLLGWRFFDHAAHLGGALFGIWYVLYGHEQIWKKREPFVKLWHDLRSRGRGGGGGASGDV